MKQLIYLLTVSFFVLSCSSDDEEIKNSANHHGIYVQDIVEFKVSSSNEIDLLNPDNNNAYLLEDIKLYYKIDEVIKEIENPIFRGYLTLVSPEDSGEEAYYLAVRLHLSRFDNAITYIEWNETDTDTVRANSRIGESFAVVSKAWYNDELLYDEDIIPETMPVIIKD